MADSPIIRLSNNIFKQNSPSSDTPWRLHRLQQELELEWEWKEQEGDLLKYLYLPLPRPVSDPSPLLGHKDRTRKPPGDKSRETKATTRALWSSSLSPQLSRPQEWSPVLFPRVEERGKERNIETFNSSHHRAWGSEPHAIRMEVLRDMQA